MAAPLAFAEEEAAPPSAATASLSIRRRIRKLHDDVVPYVTARWTATALLLTLFGLRIAYLQGWYIVAYALSIYLLNLFIAFLSPRFDPSLKEDLDEGGPSLPTKADEEFKPFVRRLPEFKFWEAATRAIILSLISTLFDIFDIPVFWPVLVVYFLALFAVTMKRQVAHMLQHQYVPFTTGKKKYSGRSEPGMRLPPE